MSLLKSLAKRVVGKLTGTGTGAPVNTPGRARAPERAANPSHSPEAPATAPTAGGRGPVAVKAGEEGPVADADALANLDAGAQEVKERVDAGEPVVILDVREPRETAHGVIPGARVIPLGELEARWKELEDCNEIVCYCAHGQRSRTAATLLRKKGLFNATSLEGGVAAWQALGGALAPAGQKAR